MHTPNFNLNVITIMGLSCSLDVNWVKHSVSQSLAKHPRFSSLLVFEDEAKYKMLWRPTEVNIDDHVLVPDLDPEIEHEKGDKFVDEFITKVARTPMDLSKPLWELYLLNVKTSNSAATAVLKLHHSIGDGVSLISVLLACGRRISDPEALPVLPASKKRPVQSGKKRAFLNLLFSVIWRFFLMVHYTLVDTLEFFATVFILKDWNPIKGDKGIEHSPKRFVHKVLNLDDVKLIKNSMNTTVNDVMFGITNAALSHYVHRRQTSCNAAPSTENAAKSALESMSIRGVAALNMRPSATVQDAHEVMHNGKGLDLQTWGNMVGFILLPLRLRLHQDPLSYVQDARAVMNKKKLSYQCIIEYHIVKMLIKILGMRKTAFVVNSFLSNVTFAFSSVMGPGDEISFFGNPLTYLAPSVYGFPVAVLIHFQSYASKLIVSMALDEKLFPDPLQLCDDFQNCLQIIKEAAMKKDALQNHQI